ncbi:MAG: phospholipid carrier-dependent glycosyltransferase, partial [Chloroflexi bacterium]|nr:phospholipid carrier-dependent glycosyltransferase [Chloroflexota bacterium]
MEIVREAARDGRRQITIIVVAFILLAFAASVINPLHEATDELRHYRFVQHIVQLRRLPVQGEMACQAQGHHPPLFYLLGTLATFWIDTGQDVCYEPPTNPFWQYRYWEVGNDNKNLYMPRSDAAFPWSGEALAAHLVRGVNILLGALTVLLTWLMARVIWLKRPSIALGTAAFVAFNPMFVFMSGAINNDVIAALGGTAVLLACIVLVKEPDGLSRKWGVALGLLYGLALMSKFNLAPLGLLIGLAVTFTAWQKKQWRLWLEVALLSLGTVAMIAGWWFVRNQMLYGEPTGFQRLTELWGKRNPAESVRLAIYELPYTWTSLWGRFGYGQIPLPEPIYIGLRWLVGVGLLGLIVPIAQRQWDELRPIGIPLVLLALDVLLFFGVLFNYLLVSPAGAMGRFFFPALPALAILTFYGLSRWLDLAKAKLPITKLAWATNILLAGLTIVTLWGYLQPAYARPSSFTIDTVVPHPTNAQFDNLVKLRGYDVNTTAVQPGDVL